MEDCPERLVLVATQEWDLGQCFYPAGHQGRHKVNGFDLQGRSYTIEWDKEGYLLYQLDEDD